VLCACSTAAPLSAADSTAQPTCLRIPCACPACPAPVLPSPALPCPALPCAACSLHQVHDEEKGFEMELAWICEESGRQFQRVPQQLVEEAGEWQRQRQRLRQGGGCGCGSGSVDGGRAGLGWQGNGPAGRLRARSPALPCLCAQCRVAHITFLPTTACLPPAPPAESLAKAALEAEDMDD
jgi:hypothetical protein